MEAGIPVLSVVVGEREADPRLGGVGFCVLLAFALIPTLPGRAQKIEQLRYVEAAICAATGAERSSGAPPQAVLGVRVEAKSVSCAA